MEKARNLLHLQTLKDNVIKAEPFQQKTESKENRNADANLFVKNLSATTTPKEIYDIFSEYGNIISIKIKQNKGGECIGYGYVNYEDTQSAKDAITNLNNKDVNGRPLQVSLFSSKAQRKEGEELFPLVLVKQMSPLVYIYIILDHY